MLPALSKAMTSDPIPATAPSVNQVSGPGPPNRTMLAATEDPVAAAEPAATDLHTGSVEFDSGLTFPRSPMPPWRQLLSTAASRATPLWPHSRHQSSIRAAAPRPVQHELFLLKPLRAYAPGFFPSTYGDPPRRQKISTWCRWREPLSFMTPPVSCPAAELLDPPPEGEGHPSDRATMVSDTGRKGEAVAAGAGPESLSARVGTLPGRSAKAHPSHRS